MAVKHPRLSELRQLGPSEQNAAWDDFLGHLKTRSHKDMIREPQCKLAQLEDRLGMDAQTLQDALCGGKITLSKEAMEWSLAYKMFQTLSESPCHGSK
jgi:hypothetical protein